MPRSESAAVRVRAGAVVHDPHVVPVGAQQPETAQGPHAPHASGSGPAGSPTHRHGKPLVPRAARHGHRRQRAVEDEDADGGRHAHRIGLRAQHEHGEDEADRDREDLAGPPSRQPAAALARAETVSGAVLGAHPASPSPGGHAAGNHLMHGPCPSSPM